MLYHMINPDAFLFRMFPDPVRNLLTNNNGFFLVLLMIKDKVI